MCGFCGILFNPQIDEPTRLLIEDRLRLGATRLATRGPDDEGFVRNGRLSLIHRRLAIVDLSNSGKQPLQTTDGQYTLAVNGEIYNYKELLRLVPHHPHTPRGGSDARAILALATSNWQQLPQLLDGMFAFALHDRDDDSLLLARDPMGQKPLFVHESSFGLIFGSTIESLLPCMDKVAIDPQGLASYLLGQAALAPLTLIQGIRAIPPGVFEIHREGQVTLGSSRCQHVETPSEGSFSSLLDQAVKKRLSSLGSPMVLLSGGLDSTAIAESMSRQSDEEVTAFCLGFAESSADERPRARLVAQTLGITLKTTELRAPALEDLQVLAAGIGEPLADSSAWALFQLAKTVAEKGKVALTGDGGDELLGGYDRHWSAALTNSKRLRLGFAVAAFFASGRRREKLRACGQAKSPAEALYACQALASSPLLEALLCDQENLALIRKNEIRTLATIQARHPSLSLRQQLLIADRETNMPRDLMVKTDRASMSHSLELRSPFLDRDLSSWQNTMMAGDPLFPRRGKAMLKQHLGSKIPAAILNAPKRGFALPLEQWMSSGTLRESCQSVLQDTSFQNRSILIPGAVDILFKNATQHRGLAAELIYALTMLELTFSHYGI